MALSGHAVGRPPWQLSEEKRTLRYDGVVAANDPKEDAGCAKIPRFIVETRLQTRKILSLRSLEAKQVTIRIA